MQITIRGRNLPGRSFTSDGKALENVHVAVQDGKEPVGLVPGDAASAEWTIDVRIVVRDGDGLSVEVDLTDQWGCPLCARVRPPHASWSLTS